MKTSIVGWDGQSKAGFVKVDRMVEYSQATLEIITHEGKEHYQIKEDQRLINGQILEVTSLVETGEYLRSVSRSHVRRNPKGEEVERWAVRLGDPSWGYPDDTYCLSAFNIVLASLLSHRVEETSIHLWLNDQAVTRMIIKTMGEEDIETDLGILPHLKIRMVPDIRSIVPVGRLMARLLQPLMPASYVWIWRGESNLSARLEMKMGPGSPKMVSTITGEFSGCR